METGTRSEAQAITCSNIEATYLASLLGANSLLGIADPFHGWLTEEIQEVWERAREALTARRYIQVVDDSNSSIVTDTGVTALVGTWAFPAASFIATVAVVDSQAHSRNFHLSRNMAVEQSSVDKSSSHLVALEDARAVYERLVELFALSTQPAVPGRSIAVRATTLTRAAEEGRNSGAAAGEKLLLADGTDAQAAALLADTLAKPLMNSALVGLSRQATTWDTAGLGLLEGPNGLWRLRSFTREGENWVEAEPCDAIGAKKEIIRVMNRVLPVPLPLQGSQG